MKQSRCWKAGTAAVLIVAGLSILPREGAAWSGYIDPIEPVLFGDPDQPSPNNATLPTTERLSPAPGIDLPVFVFLGGPRVVYIRVPDWSRLLITGRNTLSPSWRRAGAREPTR